MIRIESVDLAYMSLTYRISHALVGCRNSMMTSQLYSFMLAFGIVGSRVPCHLYSVSCLFIAE